MSELFKAALANISANNGWKTFILLQMVENDLKNKYTFDTFKVVLNRVALNVALCSSKSVLL